MASSMRMDSFWKMKVAHCVGAVWIALAGGRESIAR